MSQSLHLAAGLFILGTSALSLGCRGSSEAQASESGAPSASAIPSPARSAAPVAACEPSCGVLQRCEAGRCVSACGESRVYVPATGPDGFAMGRGKPGSSDQKHAVVLSQPFCMDRTEVTVAAYAECVKAGACSGPELRDINANSRPDYKRDLHPVNQVHYRQAKAYCAWAKQSLPTEAQWEWAAGHGDGRTYPWGNDEPSCESGHADYTPGGSPQSDPAGNVGCHGGGTSEVGAHPAGASTWPDGKIHDLGGNVWEWTADCYIPYKADKQTDPLPTKNPALDDDCYVYSLRGGGWNRSRFGLRPQGRAGSKWKYQVPGLGFRCVTNPG